MCRSASSSTSPRPEMPEDAGVGSGGDAIVHELHSMPPRPGSPGAWVAATDPGGDTIVHKLPTDRVMAAGRWSGAGTGHTHPRRTLGHMSRCAIKDDGTLRSCGTGKGEARSHPFLLHLRTSPAERGNPAGKAPGRKAGRPHEHQGRARPHERRRDRLDLFLGHRAFPADDHVSRRGHPGSRHGNRRRGAMTTDYPHPSET